jgi:hypothetical protein
VNGRIYPKKSRRIHHRDHRVHREIKGLRKRYACIKHPKEYADLDE